MPQFHEVAIIGERPHNLPVDDVQDIISPVPESELALFTLKPGFFPNHPKTGEPLQKALEAEIVTSGIDVLCTSEADLTGLDVYELYRRVLLPNPEDDAKFGIGWKKDLVSYMSSGPVFSYACRGIDAFSTVQAIKNDVRRRNNKGDEWTKVVANVGHVPDREDFDISLQVLFLGGIGLGDVVKLEGANNG